MIKAVSRKKSWMSELAFHYEKIRLLYPKEKLVICFDIDGTIIDMRHMIIDVLKGYDRAHSTEHFKHLHVKDITIHENQVEAFLKNLEISQQDIDQIMNWYLKRRWSTKAILESHRPFQGVLEVIRWFQMQPNTHVALNTGRPEVLRDDTLHSLNKLGKSFKVSFNQELLHMNSVEWEKDVSQTKVEGIRYFQKAGYRIFAMVDNEPENLEAVSLMDPHHEILLLHADTLFESKRTSIMSHAVKGSTYDITELISEKDLPEHIQLVWHGVNDEANLRQFLASNVFWGECDVRIDPLTDEPVLRHDPFDDNSLYVYGRRLTLDELLGAICKMKRGIKIDLKENDALVDKIMEVLDKYPLTESNLWFNASVQDLSELDFQTLAIAYPSAILQCPVDFLAPLIIGVPEKAKEILEMFASWGLNRFSVSWQNPNINQLSERMEQWGFEVNIYNVPDLESFLQAVLFSPRSITTDFNFPKWLYFGKGSGENQKHHEYVMS